jgi:hypothetical protein
MAFENKGYSLILFAEFMRAIIFEIHKKLKMRKMLSSKLVPALLLLPVICLVVACSKGGDDNNNPAPAPDKPPVFTTNAATNITKFTATGGGNITDLGNMTVNQRGVVVHTNANPTILDNVFSTGGSGLGPYSVTITSLNSNTTYHVRAYMNVSSATNGNSTIVYGNDISFTTLP